MNLQIESHDVNAFHVDNRHITVRCIIEASAAGGAAANTVTTGVRPYRIPVVMKETLLSPGYMVDWACELRERELAAIVARLRAVYAVDASIVEVEAETEVAELAEGIRVVNAMRRAVCERQ